MNFLAHAIFADGPDDVLFGSVAGDMIGVAKADLPIQIQDGLRLHHELDGFFDTLPALSQSKSTVFAAVSHYQNAVLDVAADHVIAAHWEELFEGTLEDFSQNVYDVLEERTRFLTPTRQSMVARFRHEDWLVSYREKEGLIAALGRIAQRVKRGEMIRENISAVMDSLPIIERELLPALRDIRGHMEGHLTGIGYETEHRTQWKEGNSFIETIRRGKER
ncbi:MAG: Acyl carrier protein phosphodiesterase [Microgenomates bacterium OLB22]|nr:MAG: Acyl carrier protein phosphodiesterase [Microgenomates bacterium OLB22]